MCCGGVQSLNVTEQGHTPHYPVVWIGSMSWGGRSAQAHSCDVGQVSTTWLLVDWAHVELRIPEVVSGVDSIQVNDWEGSEQDLGWWLCEPSTPPIPAGSVQI